MQGRIAAGKEEPTWAVVRVAARYGPMSH
jgi:hypothetical protein